MENGDNSSLVQTLWEATKSGRVIEMNTMGFDSIKSQGCKCHKL